LFGDIVNCVQTYLKENPKTLPIILSLENHCSKPYQKVMANILKEMLGDALYVPSSGDKKVGDLPSPLVLQRKVVIKGKRPPEPDNAPLANLHGPGNSEDSTEEDDLYNVNSIESGDSPKEDTVAKQPSSKVLPELAALTLFHGTKYKSFEISIGSPPSHMHSISETKITKLVEQAPENPGL
jgi:hypothetical protein